MNLTATYIVPKRHGREEVARVGLRAVNLDSGILKLMQRERMVGGGENTTSYSGCQKMNYDDL